MRNMHKKVKQGFSLAEALMTMVVLGIILAFVLPSITSTKPSESKLLYKKTFYTISEAMMAVINNPDLYDTTQYDVLKHPVDTEGENFCQYLAGYLNTVGNVNCDNDNDGSFRLANGVFISNIPKKAMKRSVGDSQNPSSYSWNDATDDNLYFLISTDGVTNESGTSEDCSKRKVFHIRYASNGKVFTNSSDECENSILETGTRVQKDKE